MIELYQGDCLEVMKQIDDQSIVLILPDPHNGTTACIWDSIIDLGLMWKQLKRIIKPNRAIVIFGSQPFTTALINSNIEMFRYEWIWEKSQSTGHLNVKVMPMRKHENILVFSNGTTFYNPQIEDKSKKNIRPDTKERTLSDCYNKYKPYAERTIPKDKTYPKSILKINNVNNGEKGLHPTQKPVALMQYLIKTYSNENETVLDFAAGSFTTGVACVNLNNNFIGIELDEEYFKIGSKRVKQADNQMRF